LICRSRSRAAVDRELGGGERFALNDQDFGFFLARGVDRDPVAWRKCSCRRFGWIDFVCASWKSFGRGRFCHRNGGAKWACSLRPKHTTEDWDKFFRKRGSTQVPREMARFMRLRCRPEEDHDALRLSGRATSRRFNLSYRLHL